jgi:type I restriction enzyme, S subunit
MNPYPKYKDSGVFWLGEVPEHWDSLKIRTILNCRTERNRPDLPLLSVVREKGVVKRNIENKEENHNYIPEDLTNYKVVKSGQFAMNKMKAWQGSYGVSEFDGIVSPAYFVFDINNVGGEFFHLAMRSKAYVPFFTSASDGVRVGQWDLNQNRMKEIPFFVPPKDEQTQIARYLDWQTEKIKKFIKNKKKLIALLKEQKQNIINEAVTKGINPNVKMKNSGVEWIGEIPEHWEVSRCKYIMREINIRSENGSEEHLSMSQKHGGLVGCEEITEKRLMSANYIGGKICRKGDIVLNRLKAHLGVFAVAPRTGVISPDYTVLKVADIALPEFIECLLRSSKLRPELRVRCKGIVEGFWRLYTDDLYTLRLPLPPQKEQYEIMIEIARRYFKIEQAISKAEKEIELIQEYRTRLVSDVVTGKIDVRDVDVPDFEEEENIDDMEEEDNSEDNESSEEAVE